MLLGELEFPCDRMYVERNAMQGSVIMSLLAEPLREKLENAEKMECQEWPEKAKIWTIQKFSHRGISLTFVPKKTWVQPNFLSFWYVICADLPPNFSSSNNL